jgi:hypothetical protein
MRRRPRWVWLLPALLAVHTGCTKRELRPKKPEDPLLTTKTPVKARFLDTQAQGARAEPTAPAMPTGILTSSPKTPPIPVPVRLGSPEVDTASRRNAAALAWATDKPEVSPVSVQPGQPYARAIDYRWLQGVLERTPNEQWLLRYEAISKEGQGGKVVLEGHPRLDLFQAGDVIRVEGTLDEGKQPAPADWLPYPRYRVASVRLVQRRE